MSLSRLLLEVSPGSPRRREAWKDLYAELETLGRISSIPEQERQDIVHLVALKVLERSPLKVAGKSEGECKSYLLAMLRNRWSDVQRKRRRGREEPLEGVPEDTLEARVPEPEPAFSIAEARQLLDRVFQELHAQRAPRYRPELERAWKQQLSLVFEEKSMDEILRDDEGVTASTSVAERGVAQQRVHQSHSRLRKSLALAVDAMLAGGKLSPEEAGLARRLIGELNRCQKLPNAGVTPNEPR